MSSKDKIQKFPDSYKQEEHDRKENGGLFESLNEPEDDETGELDYGELVDARQWNLTEIRIVWLVLLGHEEKKKSVKELQPIKRVDPHVEKDTVEHRHWDLLQYWRQKGGEADQDEDGDVGNSLFSGSQELHLLPRGAALGLHLE